MFNQASTFFGQNASISLYRRRRLFRVGNGCVGTPERRHMHREVSIIYLWFHMTLSVHWDAHGMNWFKFKRRESRWTSTYLHILCPPISFRARSLRILFYFLENSVILNHTSLFAGKKYHPLRRLTSPELDVFFVCTHTFIVNTVFFDSSYSISWVVLTLDDSG